MAGSRRAPVPALVARLTSSSYSRARRPWGRLPLGRNDRTRTVWITDGKDSASCAVDVDAVELRPLKR